MKSFLQATSILTMLICGIACKLSAQAPVIPDLTKDAQTIDRTLTYNLGATGLRGWIYTKAENNLDASQGRTTTASRQILVTHVGVSTPADGVVQVDDVILGVNGKPFNDDARKSIACAIQEAETEAKAGNLKLMVSRGGQVQELNLKLAVLGTYSKTAPWDCPKSQLIFEQACKVLEKEEMTTDWAGPVRGLALLATGKPEYLPKLREFAHKLAEIEVDPNIKPDGPVWGETWSNSHRNIFLCEYYLITKDPKVVPAISKTTLMLARGQSAYGTFGHGFAALTKEGKFNGSVPPYGPVNSAGLPANLSIVLAKKCGVKNPEVDQAIARAAGFFGYYAGKGSIPYGEHEPWQNHEINGKNAICAIMFAAMGDKPKEAEFFARSSTAAWANREYAHTGQGFSYLWSTLGAAVGGPEAAAAFFRKSSWHLDLVRRSDGSFTYDGGEQYGPGQTHDNTYFGNSSYNGLSPAATYVLAYSLPLRKLIITGRDADQSLWLDNKAAALVAAAGRFDLDRLQMPPELLLLAFDNWSPVVRSWAAEELARRPEGKTMIPQLIQYAESENVYRIQAACETLGRLNAAEGLSVIVKRLSHEDRWVRYKSAEAIRFMGGNAKPALEEILKALISNAEPLTPIRWEDPIQFAQLELAKAVFSGPLKDHLNEVDPDLRYAATRSISTSPSGMTRSNLRGFFENQLTEEDVIALAPAILAAIESPSPADTMFNNEIRMAGLKVLAKYHFKECIPAAAALAMTQGGHGSENRTGEIMQIITSYGSAAKPQIPALRKVIDFFNHETINQNAFPPQLNERRVGAIEDAIRSIETATTQPELRTIKK
jgi:hypothetical protein